MSTPSPPVFNLDLLRKQAEFMKQEIIKAAESVKHLPVVENALALYDEQLEKLRHPLVRVFFSPSKH